MTINKILKYIYALSCTDYNTIIRKIENELKKKIMEKILMFLLMVILKI